MKNPPDRETVKRKWSAEKSAGPLILAAEWLQKRLIQHAWPCEYTAFYKRYPLGPEENADSIRHCYGVEFHAVPGKPRLSSAFWDAFDIALRVVCYEAKIQAWRESGMLYLDGDYHVNKYGKIKRGVMPPPF